MGRSPDGSSPSDSAVVMYRRYGGVAAGLAILMLLAGILLIRERDRFSSVVPGLGEEAAAPLRRPDVPAFVDLPVSDVRGAIEVIGVEPAAERSLSVSVDAPDGAESMQLDTDPAFSGAEWVPLADSVEVPVDGTGFQTVYVRFMLDDGSVSRTSVAGGEVDPTYQAAVSSENAVHSASWVRPFSATEVVVRVEAGRLVHGSLEAYDLENPSSGDDVSSRNGMEVVERDGEVYGLQVSERTDAIRRPDRLIGRPLDIDAVVGGRWSISSSDDPAYASAVVPSEIRHVSRPAGGGLDGDLNRVFEVVHDIVITLPSPLQPGASYEINPTDEVDSARFEYDPTTNISPAVRVNQVGYAPGDELKVGYLAGWFDGIGESATAEVDNPPFQVFDAVTGEVVLSGTGSPRSARNELEQGDLTGTPVIELDFSALTEPGRYRICVDEVGCSYNFSVDDAVWQDLTSTVARAMYHQRSGIELGPPFTPIARPRPYHPDDGVEVLASDYTLLAAQTDTVNTDFSALADQGTDRSVAEAWGGHMDAGDWDRRINHLWYARNAAQLVVQFPDVYGTLNLNIPESGDAIPDLLDEALWSIDVYRRMQTDDGAISGGIEASAHPPPNAASWVDDLAIFAYEPDPFASYIYAGVVAEFSLALRPYDEARADELLASAERAMAWAELQSAGESQLSGSSRSAGASDSTGDGESAGSGDAPEAGGPTPAKTVADQRTVAAVAMLAATGDEKWHDLFVETADFLSASDPALSCHAHTSCDAAWLYLQADESLTDSAIRDQLEERFVASADQAVAAIDGTAYGWSPENPNVPLIWGLGSGGAPHTSGLLKAYLLTGDEVYRNAASRAAAVSLGANPMNRSMLTGVGHEPVRHPQINDIKSGGLPVWAGTPVYGNHMLDGAGDDRWVIDDALIPGGASPSPDTVPYLWQWYDVGYVAQFNEFTVHQSHAEALLTFGTLAATS